MTRTKCIQILLSMVLSSHLLAGVPESRPRTEEANQKGSNNTRPAKEDTLAPTYSCSIHFPLDSVRFDEKRIDDCLAGINPKEIAYIHVIATATPEGSIKHNLYLSTRRAGALEGYLRNRYPDVEIHAFGGGENPKAGKMARIIIVTRKIQKITREKVVLYKPEFVTQIKEVTKVQYVDRPKLGLQLTTASGITTGERAYQFMQIAVAKNVSLAGLSDVNTGLAYRMLRSNRLMDITSFGMFAMKNWRLRRLSYDSEIRLSAGPLARALFKKSPRLESGLAKPDNQSVEFGISSALEYVSAKYMVSVEVQTTNLYQSYGLGVGVGL